MTRKKILVFPCGSEIGLEIHRALRYSSHFDLVGASSVDDHGKFVYEDYVGNFPRVGDPDFIRHVKAAVQQLHIDALYPTMDEVIFRLKAHEPEIGCIVISSPLATAELCYSKKATYAALGSVIPVPQVFNKPDEIGSYPVFVKPDKGYGSRGAKLISSGAQLEIHLAEFRDTVIMEYLPGPEFTVDCFTDRAGVLQFVGPRQRKRIMNGISVNSATNPPADPAFREFAERINNKISFRGAWFFQSKENKQGKKTLLEVASRLAGTSSVYRAQGINFAMLSVFDALDYPVEVIPNSFHVEVDRALDNRYHLNITYMSVYVDLDDTLIQHHKLNVTLMAFIFQCLNDGKKVVLITKHEEILKDTLEKYRIGGLFSEIIHLTKSDRKADYIKDHQAVFIDDSFAERKEVMTKLGIPVFAPDAVECLLN